MIIAPRWKLVLGTVLLLALGHCTAQSRPRPNVIVVQDEEENDLSLAGLADQVEKIPDIGPPLKDLLNYIGESLMVISQLLNAVIARLLGGSLPCELANDSITCSGASKEGGVFGIVEELIDQLLIPEVIKKMMMDLIKRTVNPVADVLLGGLPLPSKNKNATLW